jgi:hypothetical protein
MFVHVDMKSKGFPKRGRTGDFGGLPNGYNSYDRRPVAICPSVTHNQEERLHFLYLSVCAHKKIRLGLKTGMLTCGRPLRFAVACV